MADIIDFSIYQKEKPIEQAKPEEDDLSAAIQTLIQQLRKAPLKRIG